MSWKNWAEKHPGWDGPGGDRGAVIAIVIMLAVLFVLPIVVYHFA